MARFRRGRRSLAVPVALATCAALAGMTGCWPSVDYGDTSYQCNDGVSCPGGFLCVEDRCVADPGPPDMVDVGDVTFTMGCTPDQEPYCPDDAQPAHQVTLTAFSIDQTETTQLDYWKCVSDGACDEPDRFDPADESSEPITRVSWFDAEDYCAWAGKRLPSEAEWELMARGTNGAPYPWGSGEPTCQLAHYGGCSPDGPADVGTTPGDVAPLGADDLAGNVSEWTGDWYSGGYYAISPPEDPGGPGGGFERVVRGGNFDDDSWAVVGWRRDSRAPDDGGHAIGFRCAR